jgi:hypothetical protein
MEAAENRSPTGRAYRPATHSHRDLRSKVTNGKRVFAIGGDGKGAWTRRWRDLVELHVSDLGGAEACSEAQLSLCRRIATTEVELERLEARMSEGDDTVDLDVYNRCAGNLRRMLESIGLHRVAREVGPPSLADISRHIKAERRGGGCA